MEHKPEVHKAPTSGAGRNTTKPIAPSGLDPHTPKKWNTPQQPDLLHIEMQTEVDGIGMGVLSDGTPFLAGRGLARLCGINAGRISEMQSAWDTDGRDASGRLTIAPQVKQILAGRGITLDRPHIELQDSTFYAYSDALCLAVLEYYAFDAANPNPVAIKNFRLLAGKALADFIFAQVGYNPRNAVAAEWRQFHDRVALTHNAVPRGFFSIFKELADMCVTLGQAGLLIDEKFVPDISVGICWSKYWEDEVLREKHGERVKYDHNYPGYFPQALSNPQEAWCYPESALADFRKWLREEYIEGGKFKNYITQKVKQKQLPVLFTQLALGAYTPLP